MHGAPWSHFEAQLALRGDVHVRRLREKLPARAHALRTVRSLGYKPAEGE